MPADVSCSADAAREAGDMPAPLAPRPHPAVAVALFATLLALAAAMVVAVVVFSSMTVSSGPSPTPAQTASPGVQPTAGTPAVPVPPEDLQQVSAFAGTLVGSPVDDALAAASRAGLTARVVRVDGQDLAVTMDWSVGRLNLTVLNGKVVGVEVEGADESSSPQR